ncbi:MAG: winged helix-turn-helix domain-containing protein [Acidobacteriota bacterium]
MPRAAQVFRIGEWVLDPELHQLTGPEDSVHLEPRTAAVLLELARHAGRVLSRDELLDAVWDQAFVGEGALTHCIWELRKAFGDDAKNPSFIQTVPRRGYRLLAPVSRPAVVAVRALVIWRQEVAAAEADELCQGLLGRHEGRPICFGDPVEGPVEGVFGGLFRSAVAAVRFALGFQQEWARQLPALGAPAVSVHLDEVEVQESTDSSALAEVGGSGVSLATALVFAAVGRQVLVSRSVFDLSRAAGEEVSDEGATLRWLAHGDYALEGATESIEVFEVGVEGFAPLSPPAGGTGLLRPTGVERTVLGWRPASALVVPQRPHWQLVRKLGEGGFGEVWLTRHAKTGDFRVFKFCTEVERLRALQREVTLFRLLKEGLGDRRDIARILDWNFDEAPYFLELEYVEGGSLADWAESQGGLEEIPLATRLEVVAQACEALASAHSIGILHKDVKPGNLLLGEGREGEPRVCLTDFGIGRVSDPSQLAAAGITALGLTETHDTSSESGTRLYLAPELLEGKPASIQSDLYALGVVLYQSVVGRFDRAIGPGWQRDVEDDLLREDIALCVDRSPKQRSMSALDIAERLRTLEIRRHRWEEERRRLAEAEATRQALAHAQRRRRLLSALAAVAGLVAVVVSVLTFWAVEARHRAEAHRERAETLVSFLLGDLRGTLEGVGRLDALESAAGEVLRYYGSLPVEEMTDEALARHAEALRQIGDVRMRAGSLERAEEAFAEAARVAESLARRDASRAQWQADLADSRFWLGDVQRRRGNVKAALKAFEAHRSVYGRLVSDDPARRKWRLELAYGHGNVGGVLADLGRSDEAREQMTKRLEIIEQLVAEEPEDRELQLALASSFHRLGRVLERQGDLAGALERYRSDHRVLLQLTAEEPEDSRLQERLATSAGYVGLIHWLRGDAAAAQSFYETEQAVFERLLAIDGDNARWQRNLAIALGKVGRARQFLGDLSAAEGLYRRSLEMFEGLVERDESRAGWRRELAARHLRLADLALARGAAPVGLDEADRARRVLESVLDRNPADRTAQGSLGAVELLRGEALRAACDESRARQTWQRARDLLEPLATGAEDGRLLADLARALILLGETESALPLFVRLRRAGYRAPDFVEFCRRSDISYLQNP